MDFLLLKELYIIVFHTYQFLPGTEKFHECLFQGKFYLEAKMEK